MNFAKFLRTRFLTEYLWWLLLCRFEYPIKSSDKLWLNEAAPSVVDQTWALGRLAVLFKYFGSQKYCVVEIVEIPMLKQYLRILIIH